MNLALSAVPIARRRQAAVMVGLFAALCCANGVVALTGTGVAVHVLGVIALIAGVLLGLIAWGLVHSIRLDLAEQRLDAVIEDALAAGGHDAACGCGHDHDPDELHVRCNHDGAGDACDRDCESCVLAGLRRQG